MNLEQFTRILVDVRICPFFRIVKSMRDMLEDSSLEEVKASIRV